MGAFVTELLSKREASFVHEILVPRGRSGHTCREETGYVCYANGLGTVLEAETGEVETFDRT